MRRLSYVAILALALVAVAAQVRTQPTGTAGGIPASATTSADIDQDAIAALNKMGAYLRTLKAFEVRTSTSTDDVLDDGQKVEFDLVANLVAQKPDHLRLEVASDRMRRIFLYNGKKFTLWAPRVNYYATVPAPPTIAELADRLEEKFDIDMPLVDLFYWGTERSNVGVIKSAIDLGPSEVEGTTCQHYAFRQEGLDWQIWIQNGDYPLPRKLVLTTLEDEARPQHRSVYSWNLAPSFNEAAFTFDPPRDAHQIVLAEAKAPSSATKQ